MELERNLIKELETFNSELRTVSMLIAFGPVDDNLLDDITQYNSSFYQSCQEYLSSRFYYSDSDINPLFAKELERQVNDVRIILKEVRVGLLDFDSHIFDVQKKIYDGLGFKFLAISQSFDSFERWFSQRIREVLGTTTEEILFTNEVSDFKTNLKWRATQTDLVELVKALIENKAVDGTQTATLEMLCRVFNFEVNDPNVKIQEIKTRKDRKPIFLDRLKTSLLKSF